MGKERLGAFSDGVIAIIITIMVLELKVPHGDTLASLRPVLPVFLSYALSFIYIGIYWNNHHHMFHLVKRVNGAVLWANLHLLFWLSLVPFATEWMGENHFASAPVAVYGFLLLMAGAAYWLLQQTLLAAQGPHSRLAEAIGRDLKGKASVLLYLAAIGFAFVQRWIAGGVFVFVALMWLLPDPRIERLVSNASPEQDGEPQTF